MVCALTPFRIMPRLLIPEIFLSIHQKLKWRIIPVLVVLSHARVIPITASTPRCLPMVDNRMLAVLTIIIFKCTVVAQVVIPANFLLERRVKTSTVASRFPTPCIVGFRLFFQVKIVHVIIKIYVAELLGRHPIHYLFIFSLQHVEIRIYTQRSVLVSQALISLLFVAKHL